MQPEEQHEFKQPEEIPYLPPAQATAVPAEVVESVQDQTSQQPVSETLVQDDFAAAEPSVAPEDVPAAVEVEPLHWQAAEYAHLDRSPMWYIALALVVLALMAIAILLIKSWTFAILVPVMAAALVVYVRRPPTVLEYTLSEKGLFINDTLHSFNEFKAFGVIHDGHEYSVSLIPVRRFRPGLSVYFPEDAGEKIVDMLGVRLPMEQLKPDAFDKIVHFLRI